LIRPLDRSQIFTEVFIAYFHWGSYGMLLGDKDVWSVELEYQLKRVVTFDSTVVSHSNVYRDFTRLFSLG